MDDEELWERILGWYAEHQRDLPWRRAEVSPWAVMVSEFMLQQTSVARVLPVWEQWLQRWPTPSALAAEPVGEALRAWGRLGYPRRVLRLHAAAQAIHDQHGGEVPDDIDVLRRLPGVGEYTAAAIAAFAHRQRHGVMDTNVRRVHWRLFRAQQFPPDAVRAFERRDADRLLPEDPETAATFSVAVMELGALVCTAARPRCDACPVADLCGWRAAGYPEYDGPPRRGQAWQGTDRQCRGRIMAVLREAPGEVPATRFDAVWPDAEQRRRCLDSLVADGLVERRVNGAVALPS